MYIVKWKCHLKTNSNFNSVLSQMSNSINRQKAIVWYTVQILFQRFNHHMLLMLLIPIFKCRITNYACPFFIGNTKVIYINYKKLFKSVLWVTFLMLGTVKSCRGNVSTLWSLVKLYEISKWMFFYSAAPRWLID